MNPFFFFKKNKGQGDATLLALQMEESGHMPRNVGGHQELEKVRELILPWKLYKENSSVDILILAQ